MNDAKWVRVAAVAGLVFVILVVVASQLQGSRPSLDDSPQKIFDYIKDHQSGLQGSAALAAVAMVAVLFWASGLLGALRKAENGTSGLAVVAVGGGVLAASTMIASSAVLATTALRIEGLSPNAARTYFTLYQLIQISTALGLAVLVGATAIVSLRRGLFTSWFRVASVVLAFVSVIGGLGVAYAGDALQIVGGLSLVLDSVWILLVSIRLWRTPELAVS